MYSVTKHSDIYTYSCVPLKCNGTVKVQIRARLIEHTKNIKHTCLKSNNFYCIQIS
jgi:hypothetical protein